jgi:hypothetical protein
MKPQISFGSSGNTYAAKYTIFYSALIPAILMGIPLLTILGKILILDGGVRTGIVGGGYTTSTNNVGAVGTTNNVRFGTAGGNAYVNNTNSFN